MNIPGLSLPWGSPQRQPPSRPSRRTTAARLSAACVHRGSPSTLPATCSTSRFRPGARACSLTGLGRGPVVEQRQEAALSPIEALERLTRVTAGSLHELDPAVAAPVQHGEHAVRVAQPLGVEPLEELLEPHVHRQGLRLVDEPQPRAELQQEDAPAAWELTTRTPTAALSYRRGRGPVGQGSRRSLARAGQSRSRRKARSACHHP